MLRKPRKPRKPWSIFIFFHSFCDVGMWPLLLVSRISCVLLLLCYLCSIDLFSVSLWWSWFLSSCSWWLVMLRPLPSPHPSSSFAVASAGGHRKSLVPLRSDALGEATEGWPRHWPFHWRVPTPRGNPLEVSGFHHFLVVVRFLYLCVCVLFLLLISHFVVGRNWPYKCQKD